MPKDVNKETMLVCYLLAPAPTPFLSVQKWKQVTWWQDTGFGNSRLKTMHTLNIFPRMLLRIINELPTLRCTKPEIVVRSTMEYRDQESHQAHAIVFV